MCRAARTIVTDVHTIRKRTVTSQSEELAALESRLRDTEERLARVAREKQSMQSGKSVPSNSQQQAYAGAESVNHAMSLPGQSSNRASYQATTSELRQM